MDVFITFRTMAHHLRHFEFRILFQENNSAEFDYNSKERDMVTREEIRGHWNELRGRIEKHWNQLSPHDLDGVEGETDQLVGKIQQKTGQASTEIRQELDCIVDDMSKSAARATEKLGENFENTVNKTKEQFQHASEAARAQYEHLNESMHKGYQQAEQTLRKNPVESVAVAFGTGLIAGVIVSLVWRR
ncbi:MAG: general stress protein CsbD [Gimesia sp.]|nr:general stress protein CsbD [Gimesia sp.]